MALSGLPPDVTQVGSIEVVLFMTDQGIGMSYGMEGVSTEAAIGYLTVVLDRLREERKLQWDTCPGCGLPWSEHFEDEDEDDEDTPDDEDYA